jgi:hypothetical protein
MKYLKLFEKFIDEPSFYRFNKTDILGQEDSRTIFPRERLMVGPENVNDVVVKNGFPDKKSAFISWMRKLLTRRTKVFTEVLSIEYK